MKALTVWQPWASLVVLGLKSVEVRLWSTRHRGPLLIHAGQKIDEQAKRRFGLADPPVKAVLGTVDLVDVKLFTRDTWHELAAEHLAIGDFVPNLHAWHLANPRALEEPIPYRGERGLFEISVDDLALPGSQKADETDPAPGRRLSCSPGKKAVE